MAAGESSEIPKEAAETTEAAKTAATTEAAEPIEAPPAPARTRPRRTYLEVERDYGVVANSATKPRSVLATNGSRYLIKGPSLSPERPYVAANELVVVELANWLGLPVLDHRILQHGAELVFGSLLMSRATFHDSTTEELFGRCQNRDKVYELIAFDTWIRNTDRHHQNLLIRIDKVEGGTEEMLFLIFNDHSECPLHPGLLPTQLGSMMDTPLSSCIRLDFLKKAVVSTERLNEAIETIESTPDDDVMQIVKGTPQQWLSDDEKILVADFLCQRKSRVRALIKDGRSCFPNIVSGDL